MQKISLKKISILGLVLMAASAVTAAMVPAKADKKVVAGEGSLTFSSDGEGLSESITCNPDSNFGNFSQGQCTASSELNASATTTGQSGAVSSNDAATGNGGNGQDNTTSGVL
jgi:hypothetical protein